MRSATEAATNSALSLLPLDEPADAFAVSPIIGRALIGGYKLAEF